MKEQKKNLKTYYTKILLIILLQDEIAVDENIEKLNSQY